MFGHTLYLKQNQNISPGASGENVNAATKSVIWLQDKKWTNIGSHCI